MIQDEDVLISITQKGYIKRTPLTTYRIQTRNGRRLINMSTHDKDELIHLFATDTLNHILFFTDRGKVYSERAFEIPELDRTAKGSSLMSILPIMPNEKVTVALPVHSFEDAEYLTMITRKGRIKRVGVSAFESVRTSGLIAVNLDEDDALGWVKMTRGGQDLIVVSEMGRAIRFNEEDVRAVGRTAAGVHAMRLAEGDYLTGADVIVPDLDLLLITEKGYGKRTSVDEFRQQSRYGKGVRSMELSDLTGKMVSVRVVERDDEVTFISANGIILRTSASAISCQGRYSRGVNVMDLKGEDVIVSVAIVREGALSQVDGDEAEQEGAEGETEMAVSSPPGSDNGRPTT